MLIIGGGISGLEAARLLREYGVKTLILEGRNRTGGRIWSIRSKSGHMIDMGAAWIHGINGSIPNGLLSNPLWDLIKKANISTRPTQRNDFEIFYPINDTISNVESWFNEYMNFIREETRLSLTNISIGYYSNLFIKQKKLTKKQEYAFNSYLHNMIECTEGAQLNSISAKGLLDITSVHYGDEHVLHDNGFMQITDYLTKYAGKILFNKIVKKINSNDEFVEVETNDGFIYRSLFVILTVPLGVLKTKQIKFVPQLPQWKLDVIDRLGFGNLDKIILIWNQSWWNSTNYYFMRISSKPNHFGYWVNENKWNDKPVIISFFPGISNYRQQFIQNKTKIVEDIICILQEMFPNINIPLPVETYLTNWNEDPLSSGSYSYISINQKYEDPFYLSEPINNRLLFAGEATSTDSYGYAHGALITARREVTRLIYVYHLLSKKLNNIN